MELNRKMQMRHDGLDLLRGVAISAVVVWHYWFRFDPSYLHATPHDWPAPPLWLGVDLFFVISGYCIAMTLAQTRDVCAFWAARIARLQPAYLAAVALTFAVVAGFGLPDREVGVADLLANAIWLNAVGFAPHVDGVYWSLVVELKFYLVVGFVWTATGSLRGATLGWAALCAASAILMAIKPNAAQTLMLHPYNFLFLFGMTLFAGQRLARVERLVCHVLVVAGVLTAARYVSAPVEILVVLALAATGVRVRRARWAAPLLWIGLLSYSWYLIHQNVGLVVIRELNIRGLEVVSAPVAIAVTLALAAALAVLVEHRFRTPLQGWLLAGAQAARRGVAAARALDPHRGQHPARLTRAGAQDMAGRIG